jgi:hypothetical protein
MDEGRLTIVSGIGGTTRRQTRDLALRRNLLVAVLSDGVLIPHATPGGVAERVAQRVAQWGERLLTFREEANANLFALDAKEIEGRGYRREFDPPFSAGSRNDPGLRPAFPDLADQNH